MDFLDWPTLEFLCYHDKDKTDLNSSLLIIKKREKKNYLWKKYIGLCKVDLFIQRRRTRCFIRVISRNQ